MRGGMKKSVLYFAVLVILAVAAAGCVQTAIKEEQKPPIRIAMNPWAGYAHAFVAQEKGIFKNNGVDVELVFVNDYSEAKALYRDGAVDGVFIVYADAIMLDAGRTHSKVVYVTDFSESGDMIIGKKEINSPGELKGKTLGVDGINSFSHMFVLSYLEKNGLSEGSVRFKNVPAQDIPAALAEGTIDAGHTWDPFASDALSQGNHIIGTAADVPGIITDVLVFNPEIVKSREKDVQAIVKSLVEAREFVFSNRTEAIGIMALAENMTADELASSLDGIKQLNLTENIEAMKQTEGMDSLYGSGNVISDFFMQRGQLSRVPHFDEIIEPKFVNGLK